MKEIRQFCNLGLTFRCYYLSYDNNTCIQQGFIFQLTAYIVQRECNRHILRELAKSEAMKSKQDTDDDGTTILVDTVG